MGSPTLIHMGLMLVVLVGAGAPGTARAADFDAALDGAAEARRDRPDEPPWLMRRDDPAPLETIVAEGQGAFCIVLQEDRPDGTELLTARYTLRDSGALRTYAGAGLNQARYFHDANDEPGPTAFTRRNRGRSLGAAAELGAELRVSARVLVSADVRWADLDARAEALRSAYGPVGADPVVVGVGVGYRFR